MKKWNPFLARILAGAILAILSVVMVLVPLPTQGNTFLWMTILTLGLPIASIFCFLPLERIGLWLGGLGLILAHLFLQQPRPGMLLQLLVQPPDPMHEPGLLYVLYGFCAFLCFLYLCVIVASVFSGEKPINPRRRGTKTCLIIGWIVLILSICFPKVLQTIDLLPIGNAYFSLVVSELLYWGQYFLTHWLIFVSVAWIVDIRKAKKEAV
jgi:hypothetical protein